MNETLENFKELEKQYFKDDKKESRLGNIVSRLRLPLTRKGAPQLVNHGHALVNGKTVIIPSYHVKPGDKVTATEKAQKNTKVIEALKVTKGHVTRVEVPSNTKEGIDSSETFTDDVGETTNFNKYSEDKDDSDTISIQPLDDSYDDE
uniref:30S ribosomal protein S4 n=1 Tax=Eufriesea mexicana TaxID=516756 RepID=A0A310SC10_9HYME